MEVSEAVDLRIMETTDLHVHLHPYDYYADCPNPDLGLSRLAELIDLSRAQVPNCLLFDNGDFLQGTPMGDFYAYDKCLRAGDLHPVIASMNALRYDAITPGNHEFSYGLDFLMRSVAPAEFPVVSANILRQAGGQARRDTHLFRPYQLLHRQVTDRAGRAHPICIGVIGVAPAQITIWERQHLHGKIQTRDMVEAVRAWVPEMREAGADLVVLLAHSGIGKLRHEDKMENAVIPLAGIDGVDVILCGHMHRVFPSPEFMNIPGVDPARGRVLGKPTVMGGFHGSHLGLIDLTLTRIGRDWEVLDARVQTQALRDTATKIATGTARVSQAPMRSGAVRRIVERAHDAVIENIRQPIGMTRTPINSFFVYLGRSAATALVAAAQSEFVSRHLAQGPFEGLPLLSAVSPCKAGGLGGPRNYTNVESGLLTLRALADLYVFPNRIAALKVRGADLFAWLERSASAYVRTQPGVADQPLTNPDYPGYNFEIIYGLAYEIDLSGPARFGPDGCVIDPSASRIRNVTWQGKPVQEDAEFILCTNSFRAQGAGGFAGTGSDSIVLEHPAITRDILRAYVTRVSPVSIPAQAPFRLLACEGSSAVLKTGIAALAHLDEIADFAPQILGADDRGFMQVRVTL